MSTEKAQNVVSSQRSKSRTQHTPAAMPDNPSQPTGAEKEFTMADIMRSVKQSEVKVCEKLDQVQLDLTIIKKKVGELEMSVADNSARVLDIEKEKLPKLESKLREKIDLLDLEKKMIESEIYQRKSNLLFYGVQKSGNENVHTLYLKKHL